MATNQGGTAISLPVYKSFEDKEIRRGFIRKVFSLVAAQLTVATACVLITTLVGSVHEYLTEPNNTDVAVGALIAAVVTYIITAIMVYCVPNLSKRYPANLILLFILTAASAIMLSIICSAFEQEAVIIALGITILCCVGIFVFSFNTKYDLGSWQGVLFCLFFGILCTSVLIPIPIPYSSIVAKISAGLAAIIFMFILVVDIHRIMGKSPENALSPEEYVLAALQIYSDIIIFFLIILLIVVLIAGDGKGGDCKCGGGNCGDCDCGSCYCGDCGGCGGGNYAEGGNSTNRYCFFCCIRGGGVTGSNSAEREDYPDAVHVQQPSKIAQEELPEEEKQHGNCSLDKVRALNLPAHT